jgi:hypothetical protein
MSLEVWWWMDVWLNNVQIGEQGEVSAEAIELVREDIKKSGEIRGQIAQAGKQNKKFAQLLILLLQHITDEKLIGHIFRQLTVQKHSIPAIFSQFLPFIVDHVAFNVSSWPFVDLIPKAKQMPRSLEWVVGWMKEVMCVFVSLSKQTNDQKASLVIDLAQVYNFTRLEDLSEEQRHDLWELVKKEMG